jgi:hypothetical protein
LITQGTLFDADATGGSPGSLDWFGRGGLVARAVYAESAGTDPQLSSQPIPDGSLRAEIPQEGGLISLASNIVLTRHVVAPKETESPFAPSLTRSELEAESVGNAKPTAVTTSARELTGEWARAAVFEIAGGEPIVDTMEVSQPQDQPVAVAIPNSPQPVAKPPISDVNSSSVHVTAPDAVIQASPKAEPVDTNDVSSISPATDMPLPLTAETAVLTIQLQAATRRNDPTSRAHTAALAIPRAAAFAAVFDEIGRGDTVLPAPSTDRLRPDSWLGGTPLLLMFALERVTSRKTRRHRTTPGEIEAGRGWPDF